MRDIWGHREDFKADGTHDDTGKYSSRFYPENLTMGQDTISIRLDPDHVYQFARNDGALLAVRDDKGANIRLEYETSAGIAGSQSVANSSRLKYGIHGISRYATPRGYRATVTQDFRVNKIIDGDDASRFLTVNWDTSGMVGSIVDPVGGKVSYQYDEAGNLTQVKLPDGSIRRYRWNDTADIHRLTAFDPKPIHPALAGEASLFLRNTWDRISRVTNQKSPEAQWQFFRSGYDFGQSDIKGILRNDGLYDVSNTDGIRTTQATRKTLDSVSYYGGMGARSSQKLVTDVVTRRQLLRYPWPIVGGSGGSSAGVGPEPVGSPWFVSRRETVAESVNGEVRTSSIDYREDNSIRMQIRADSTVVTDTTIGNVETVVETPKLAHGLVRTTKVTTDATGHVLRQEVSSSLGSDIRTWTRANGLLQADCVGEGASAVCTQYGYDAANRLATVTDPAGVVVRYGYPGASMWPDTVAYPDGSGERYTYDRMLRVVAVRNSFGQVQTSAYDALGRDTLSCAYDGRCVRRVYDASDLVRVESGGVLQNGAFIAPKRISRYENDAFGHRTKEWMTSGADTAKKVLRWKSVYDGEGKLVQLWDNPDTSNVDSANWRLVQSRTYDGFGQETSITDTSGDASKAVLKRQFSFDSAAHPVTMRDNRGRTLRQRYDTWGNLLQDTSASGAVHRYGYDQSNRVVADTNPSGVTTHAYDAQGNEVKRIGYRNDTSLWIYAKGRLVKSRTPEGRWTVYQYDGMGRVSSVIRKVGDTTQTALADDQVVTWTYDAVGNRVTETVADKKTHGWKVDGAGKVLADTNATGAVTSYGYDSLGQLVAVVGPAGDTLSVGYDGRGAVSVSRIGTDTLMQARSNSLGLPVWTRRPGQGAVTSTFDGLGHVRSVTDSLGRSFGFAPDAYGLDSLVSNGTGNRQAIRDAAGRLVKLLDEKKQATLFTWDNLDRLKSVTTPTGIVTSYVYTDSSNGWQIRTTTRTAGGISKSESHAWDRDGLLRRFTDGRGISAEYGYDSLARMTGIVYMNPDGSQAGPAKVFRYTPEGWTRAMEFGSVTDSFGYDGLGRVLTSIQTIGSNSYTTEHRYDDKNRLDTLITPDGIKSWRRTDARGRTVALYRNGVRLDTLVWQGTNRMSRTLGNGIQASYGYDAAGRMTSLAYAKGTTTLTSYAFGYTAAGKLAWQQRLHAPSQSEVYAWTDDGQLASVSRGTMDASHAIAAPTWVKSYAGEPSGNWPSITTNTTSQALSYSGYGELTGIGNASITWDAAGNQTSDGTRSLTWTPDGRLASAGGESFTYDALGRVVNRTVGGTSVDLVYDGWREVYSKSTSGEAITRVWGNYLDEALAEIHATGLTESVIFPLAGNNWNTEVLTDGSGNITRTYLVDPFGTFTVATSAGADGKWWTADDVAGDPASLEGERIFQGLPWYGSTGLYHLRNRWYSPSQSRFVSLDPLGFEAGDANLYRFEGNDPLGHLDPMGTLTARQVFRTVAISAGIGFGVGIALPLAPVWLSTAAVYGGAALLGAGIAEAGMTIRELMSGKERGTGRKLCANELRALSDHLILGAIGLASGGAGASLGAKLSAPLAEALGLSGQAGSAGAEVSAAEAEASLTPRAGEGPPDAGGGSKALPSQSGNGANQLDWSRTSPRTGGNSADHVIENHGSLSLTKPTQGVFYGDPISTTENAWASAQQAGISPVTVGSRDVYVIPSANSGFAGGMGGQGQNLDYITIITETGTNRAVTAFPSGGTPPLPKGYPFMLGGSK